MAGTISRLPGSCRRAHGPGCRTPRAREPGRCGARRGKPGSRAGRRAWRGQDGAARLPQRAGVGVPGGPGGRRPGRDRAGFRRPASAVRPHAGSSRRAARSAARRAADRVRYQRRAAARPAPGWPGRGGAAVGGGQPAAAQHDVGWALVDLEPRLNEETGLPRGFLETTVEEHLAIWRDAPDRLASQSLDAALVVSMHGCSLSQLRASVSSAAEARAARRSTSPTSRPGRSRCANGSGCPRRTLSGPAARCGPGTACRWPCAWAGTRSPPKTCRHATACSTWSCASRAKDAGCWTPGRSPATRVRVHCEGRHLDGGFSDRAAAAGGLRRGAPGAPRAAAGGTLSRARATLPSSAHYAQPWRVHEITRDFRLEDVWALPAEGGAGGVPAAGGGALRAGSPRRLSRRRAGADEDPSCSSAPC